VSLTAARPNAIPTDPSAKVPTIIHAALTNLLVFHVFLDQNENYRSTKAGMAATELQPQLGVTGSVEVEEADDPSIAPGPATASDWGLTFTDLTEEQLMNGFILRERLVQLLDHPSLTNHLLRAKNLLPLLVCYSSALFVNADITGLEIICRASSPSIHTQSDSDSDRIWNNRKCSRWGQENQVHSLDEIQSRSRTSSQAD
jgi:hypothetical protein